MKRVGAVLGITGVLLIGVSLFFKQGHLTGSGIIYSVGTLLFNFGLLYLLAREWRSLNRMKRTEYLLGIMGAFLLINGMLFKFMHWPSAAIQMTLAVVLFNFGFLPLQLHLRWREAETRLLKAYAVVRFTAFFLILTGFIFKTMHWPGAGLGLALGMFLIPVYLLFYFILRIKEQGKLPFEMGDLLITILAFFIWMYASLNQIPSGAVEGYRLMEDQYIGMNEGIESANDLIFESIDSLAGELDASVTRSIRDLKALGEQCTGAIDSIKDGLFRQLLGEMYRAGENHRRMSTFHLANYDAPGDYFIVKGKGDRVKEIVDAYREGTLEIAGRYHLSSGSIGLGLETDDIVYRSGYRQPWVSYLFEDVPAGSVIISISYLKQMILLTESAVLNGLIAQVDLSGEARLLQEMAARESDKAIELKEHEIARVKQEQALQEARLEQSLMETKQNRMMAIFAFGGVAVVLVLFSISTRAYLRKQKDNRLLAEQKRQISEKNEALNQQNEEISAQRDEIEAQRDMVTRQKEMIEASHEEISASIDYATRLQTSILPNMSLLEETFSDHFVFFRPKQKVSGDFYWWTRVEDRVLVTAADCTGHGVPGAFMSMLGVSLLREIVNREYITHPGVVLNRLRKEVIRSLDQKGEHGEQKDGMDLALISVQPDTMLCEYAGANNSLYLVRNGELTEYRADRMPISHYPRLDRFANNEIQLQKGDQLYLFSDGYADQFGGEKRKKFKYKNFAKLLVEITSRPMREQHDILLETILAWQGEIEQIDDMVIVGIKI